MAREPVRLRDVAERAGVTVSTASRALSRPEMVRPDTRARVESAARDLGYTPNRMAQAIVTGRSRTIVFIVPDLTSPMFAMLARAAQAEARARAFNVLVTDSMTDIDARPRCSRAPGTTPRGSSCACPRASTPRTPTVRRSWRSTGGSGAHAVLLDQANVIEQQLGHLVGLGHERIVYLDGPKQYWATYERRRHAERLARDFPLEIIGPIQPFFHGGYEAADRLDPATTAVIAFTDTQAAGVIVRMTELGRRVPTDVSVIGSNDIPIAHMFNPPLTTMHTPFEAMGRAAVSLLLDAVDGAAGTTITETMTSELVVRGSTAPRAHLTPRPSAPRRRT